jgi:putative membrane protein
VFQRIGLQALRGFMMGAADIVPGVSGGTIALLLGIYDELVENIKTAARALGSLARLDFSGAIDRLRRVEWLVIVPLLIGLLAAVAALSSLIESLLRNHPEAMAGLFTGLVLASIVVAIGMVETWTRAAMATVVVVAVVVFVLLGLQNGPVSDPSNLAWFGAGAIAICAMILPGISGSFLLLMLGMYGPVLAAVNDRELGHLAVFLVGLIVGLALFSNVLSHLLAVARSVTLAALTGLMVGSIRVLWPWPNGVGIISENQSEVIDGTAVDWPAPDEIAVPLILAVAAFVVVVGLSRLASRRDPVAVPTAS